jgi:hypothetical protein
MLILIGYQYMICKLINSITVRFTLRLTVYRQSVRLGAKLVEANEQIFFFLQLNPCGHSPYVSSSLTRGWAFLI